MLKAWKVYKSKTLECECMVIDDERLHNENDKYVTSKMMNIGHFTIISKDDLEDCNEKRF